MKTKLCVLMTTVFLLFSCTGANLLEYQSLPLVCTAVGTKGGREYALTLYLGEGGDMRDACAVFEKPRILQGVKVSRTGGVYSLCRGDISIEPSADMDGLLEFAELFCISGEVKSVQRGDTGGVQTNIVHYTNGECAYTLYIDRETELPIKIEGFIDGQDIMLDIISLDFPN